MTPADWCAENGGWEPLVTFSARFSSMAEFWAALTYDGHTQAPTDVERAVWLSWVVTRQGTLPDGLAVSLSNQLIDGMKASNGGSILQCLLATCYRGIEVDECIALDVIEASADTEAMKTLKIVARVSAWPSRPECRPHDSALTWIWIAKSLAILRCPF